MTPIATERPSPPEFRAPQRVRYGISLALEDGDNYVGEGWAMLDDGWLHVVDDEHGYWQTWPARHVQFVEWTA